MTRLCNDVDLLKWEPMLFRDLAPADQTLCKGNDGEVDGTTFSASGASFTGSAIEAGHVIYLYDDAGTVDGCYEVVSVDSETQLTISVIRHETDAAAVAPPNGSGLNYRISTFDPQVEEASYSLFQYFGIATETEIQTESICNIRALRQSCVFAVLSTVFSGNAYDNDNKDNFWRKSLHYQKLFHTARARCRLEIDTDSDDTAEQFKTGGSVQLRRV